MLLARPGIADQLDYDQLNGRFKESGGNDSMKKLVDGAFTASLDGSSSSITGSVSFDLAWAYRSGSGRGGGGSGCYKTVSAGTLQITTNP